MTNRDDGRPRRPLDPETLKAIAAARGIDVDEASLEELRPLVVDMFDLIDGIERWLDQQAAAVPAAPASGGPAA